MPSLSSSFSEPKASIGTGRTNVTMTLQLLSRYRPPPLQHHLLRPLRQIQKMSSQPPQLLSTEDLNTADAKYVTYISPQSHSALISNFPKRWVSLKKINWQDESGRAVGQSFPRILLLSALMIPLRCRGSGRLQRGARAEALASMVLSSAASHSSHFRKRSLSPQRSQS